MDDQQTIPVSEHKSALAKLHDELDAIIKGIESGVHNGVDHLRALAAKLRDRAK